MANGASTASAYHQGGARQVRSRRPQAARLARPWQAATTSAAISGPSGHVVRVGARGRRRPRCRCPSRTDRPGRRSGERMVADEPGGRSCGPPGVGWPVSAIPQSPPRAARDIGPGHTGTGPRAEAPRISSSRPMVDRRARTTVSRVRRDTEPSQRLRRQSVGPAARRAAAWWSPSRCTSAAPSRSAATWTRAVLGPADHARGRPARRTPPLPAAGPGADPARPAALVATRNTVGVSTIGCTVAFYTACRCRLAAGSDRPSR